MREQRLHATHAAAMLVALLFAAPLAAQQEGSDAEDEAFLSGETTETQAAAPTTKPEERAAPEAKPVEGQAKERPRDHAVQGFVNVYAGTGWYMVAPYDKNDEDKACSERKPDDSGQLAGDPVCTGRSGVTLDILGGYGVLPGFEVFVMFRQGLESPALARPRGEQIGAGVKIYSPSDGLFKIGFGVAPLFDFSGRKADLGYDFVVHVPIQAQFDFVPWFGAYVQVAPNISFITEFRLDITGGLGVQGRFP
ncbi:MAG: hypothetical protein PHU25_19850 [Deltaproteobacteria bacterium]|nr:hypothetical protein [Deltaproteobacteria bacterium]